VVCDVKTHTLAYVEVVRTCESKKYACVGAEFGAGRMVVSFSARIQFAIAMSMRHNFFLQRHTGRDAHEREKSCSSKPEQGLT